MFVCYTHIHMYVQSREKLDFKTGPVPDVITFKY